MCYEQACGHGQFARLGSRVSSIPDCAMVSASPAGKTGRHRTPRLENSICDSSEAGRAVSSIAFIATTCLSNLDRKRRLAELSSEFDRAFAISNVPPLPRILSMVSMATHQQTANHFYATVVGSKELIPLYQEVVVWMLKRDLLITLHLRIRIVATEDLKDRVRMKFEMARAKRDRIRARSQSADHDTETGSSDTPRQADHLEVASSYGTASGSSIGTNWLSLSPKSARKQAQLFSAREHGVDATHSHSDSAAEKWRGEYEDEFGSSGEEFDREDWYRSVDNNPYSSIISDPARATRLESLWLTEMSEGKDPAIARRFEKCV